MIKKIWIILFVFISIFGIHKAQSITAYFTQLALEDLYVTSGTVAAVTDSHGRPFKSPSGIARTMTPINLANIATQSGETYPPETTNEYWYCVKDSPYNATGDGIANDYTAINTAVTAIGVSNATLYFPSGTYLISSNISFNANTTLYFDKGAILKPNTGITLTISGSIRAGLSQILDLSIGSLSGNAKNDVIFPEWFGAVGDGTTDDCSEINLALSFANRSSSKVVLQSKTYNIIPATAVVDEASSSVLAAFVMTDNFDIEGIEGATLKLADGQSIDASPQHLRMFFSNSTLSNIHFNNIIMDMNGANNKISPNRGSGTYNQWTQAHILFSGTPSGIAAKADDVLIENCNFINTAGVTCIGMAQSNTASTILGKRWIIRNCLFNNNGLDSGDHSSVYGWADDVLIEGNTFTQDAMFVGGVGGLVAYEVHGANQRFINNNVKNYYQGMWVSSNLTSDCDNIIISGNNFSPINFIGVDFYRSTAPESIIKKVVIDGNTFGLDDSIPTGSVPDLKVAVLIAPNYAITDVLISNNIASKVGVAKASAFIAVSPQAVAGQTHDKIIIDGNYCTGFNHGVYLTTNATNGLGTVTVRNNTFSDITPTAVFTNSIGIYAGLTGTASAFVKLIISNNEFVDTRTSPLADYGIYIEGIYTELYKSGNTFVGQTILDYTESSPTITTRSGDFDTVAFTPTFNAGTAITIGDGTVAGQYSLKDDIVHVQATMTIGSTTTIPGGNLTLVLPFASISAGVTYQGTWRIFDNTAGTFAFGTLVIDGTASIATFQVSGGTFATHAAPITIAASDVLSVDIVYNK